jgi:predicted RNA binding protein YcfA (HicA-like mRNA interferase family)
MKIADAIRSIERDGWRQIGQRGSHLRFKYPEKPGRVTVAGKPSDDVAPGTMKSLLKQAGPTGGA